MGKSNRREGVCGGVRGTAVRFNPFDNIFLRTERRAPPHPTLPRKGGGI